jgi:dienelactone hydrolase
MTATVSVPDRPARPVEGYDASWFGPGESRTAVGHWVYRGARTGPSVILIHEAFGLSRRTLGVASRLGAAGMTPVLPLLAGEPLPRGMARFGVFARLCVAREFGALTGGEATPTAAWLRALALREHDDSGGLPVGVIGMCFSGGYAFATALEPAVKGVVSSQPAFPAAIGPWRRRFGVNPGDLAVLQANTANGSCVRTLRYQRDFMSPPARHRAIGDALPERESVEIATTNRFDHPVLTDGVDADPDTPVGMALTETVEFLRTRLVGAQVMPIEP